MQMCIYCNVRLRWDRWNVECDKDYSDKVKRWVAYILKMTKYIFPRASACVVMQSQEVLDDVEVLREDTQKRNGGEVSVRNEFSVHLSFSSNS